MNYYGFPPGYVPNPHHPRPASVANTADNSRHARARLDGGQWISGDGEWIYTERFGLWRAAWEMPEGAVKL